MYEFSRKNITTKLIQTHIQKDNYKVIFHRFTLKIGEMDNLLLENRFYIETINSYLLFYIKTSIKISKIIKINLILINLFLFTKEKTLIKPFNGFSLESFKSTQKAKIKPNLLKSCHLLSHNGLNSNGYCSNLQKSSLFLSQNGPNAYCSNEIKRSLFLSQNGFKSSNLTKSCYLLSENGLNSNGYCSNSIKSSLFLSKDGLKYLNSIKSINLSKNSSNLIKSSNLLSQNGLNSTKSTNFLSQNGLKSSNSIKSTIFLPQNSLKTSTSTKSTNLYSQNSLNTKNYCTNSIQNAKESVDLTKYLPENIRNFSIIAHVDHGKSTLADRLLELTGTIKKGIGQPQYLDKLQVERERGITVKAQTATVFHKHIFRGANSTVTEELSSFLINLIDTPGHVDFSYEVSRSLKACQGALLVVDAAQGVQAQTVANFYLAFESNLTIIPVINKIDQPTADPDRVKVQLKSLFDLDPNDALLTSATTGQGLELVLPAVIERIPHPPGICVSPLRMLLLDSYYDEYEGVICHVAVVDGALRKGDKISSAATGQSYEVLDVGFMHPELTSTGVLLTGQVGYVVSGMWSAKEARVGDTLHHSKSVVEPLPGFKPVKHMVFAGVYPAYGSDIEALSHAIERLTCNDASVSVTKESSTALGLGFSCGFLGLLHMDVFHQRLEQEYGAHVIYTVPTVPYVFEYLDGSKLEVQNPAQLPSNPKQRVTKTWEPTVLATIIIPNENVGAVITLCLERRGEQLEYSFIDSQRAFMKYRLPLREIVVDFYNELQSITSGYGSFDYEDAEYQVSDLVKLDLLLNGQPVDAMATIVHNQKAQQIGRELVKKLKKFMDRQMFEITIQAAIGSKVVATETVSAMRKNVLAKCDGGDISRKKKLLDKQNEGKKRMKRVGSVDIPPEAFHQLLKVR